MPKVAKLRALEHGRVAYVVANGPSVLSAPIEVLNQGVVIGCNATTLLAQDRGLRQDYYVLADRRFLIHPTKRALACEMLSKTTQRVLRADLQPDDEGSLAERTYYVRPLGRDGLSTKLESGFYHGCSVALLGVQLAIWLGCREINLVGIDLVYNPKQMRFYNEENPQEEDVFTSVQVRNLAEAGRICNKLGIDLSVCSERSLLRSYLPFRILSN